MVDALYIFKIILYICLSGFLIALIVFLLKLTDLVKSIKAVLADNKKYWTMYQELLIKPID